MEWGTIILLAAAGLFAGALNAVAGGATFFTFPTLLFAGLPPIAANATNYIALVPSNFTALPAFREELRETGREIFGLIAVSMAGSVAGALLLLWLGNDLFAAAVPWLMAFATALFAAAPYLHRLVQRAVSGPQGRGRAGAYALLLPFSVYGGYFGAGLGQIMLAALTISGYTRFHLANAVKNAVIAAITLGSFGIYAFSGHVAWGHALAMMAGAMVGGYTGGAVSHMVPQNVLRILVIAFGVFLTVFYFVRGA